jgi:PadR family transcriptional regulator PadR
MVKPDLPGAFEQMVLLAVLRLGDEAYGMAVRRELESRTGRETALGAVYATLDRMEAKGWVSSAGQAGAPERQGRARRFFRPTAPGVQALRQALRATDGLRQGIPGLDPLPGAPA